MTTSEPLASIVKLLKVSDVSNPIESVPSVKSVMTSPALAADPPEVDAITNTSLPAPPVKVSAPAPPSKVSSPSSP